MIKCNNIISNYLYNSVTFQSKKDKHQIIYIFLAIHASAPSPLRQAQGTIGGKLPEPVEGPSITMSAN
jgi:hypothetical protein